MSKYVIQLCGEELSRKEWARRLGMKESDLRAIIANRQWDELRKRAKDMGYPVS